MANIFQDIGRSTAIPAITETLNTALTMDEMKRRRAVEAENLSMARERMGMERERQSAVLPALQAQSQLQTAVSQDALEQHKQGMKLIPLKTHPLVVNNLGPEGTDQLLDILKKSGAEVTPNGEMMLRDIQSKLPEIISQPEVQALVTRNWQQKIDIAQKKVDELQKKMEKNPQDVQTYTELKRAKEEAAAVQQIASKRSEQLRTSVGQIQISKALENLSKADPARFAKFAADPTVSIAYQTGDVATFDKAWQAFQTAETRRKIDPATVQFEREHPNLEPGTPEYTEKYNEWLSSRSVAKDAGKAKLEEQKQKHRKEIIGIRERSIANRQKSQSMTPEAIRKRLSQINVQKANLRKSAGDPDLNPDVQSALEALNEEESGLREKLGKPQKETSRIAQAVTYLKRSKNREEAIQNIRALSAKGWSREDLAAAAKEAGWE